MGHFTDLLRDNIEAARYLKGEARLPDLFKMSEAELAELAQECDLFRGPQLSDHLDCQAVLMQSAESLLRLFRISAPERDKEQDACDDQSGFGPVGPVA
jgi:hypothetical protein